MKCGSCSGESRAGEPFNCISVQFKSEVGCTVHEMLESYYSAEEIPVEEGWRCGKCGQVSAAVKTLVVDVAPEVLIVHLKRFTFADGQMKKVDAAVGVFRDLVLAGESYVLSAMVKHSGSKLSGHYVANTLTENGWILLDDQRVERVEIEEISWCPDTYILMYVKQLPSSLVPDASNRRGPATSL